MATLKDLLSLIIDRVNGKPNSWKDLKDKPFGDTIAWEALVDEPAVTGALYGENPPSAYIQISGLSLVEGYPYRIKINNNEFETIAYCLDEGDTIYLGDSTVMFDSYPFHIFTTISGICICWKISQEAYNDADTVANIQIDVGKETIVPVAHKFMPEDYPAVLEGYKEILPTTTIVADEYNADETLCINTTVLAEDFFEIDESYKITCGDKIFESTCIEYRDAPFIGNLGLINMQDDDGTPIAILGNMICWKKTIGDTIELKAEIKEEVIRPIDEKFIPSSIARKTDIDTAIADLDITSNGGSGGVSSWNDLADKPFYKDLELNFLGEMVDIEMVVEDGYVSPNFTDIVIPYNSYKEDYVVEFNGVKYEVTLREVYSSYHVIGNMGLYNPYSYPDDGVPFAILLNGYGSTLYTKEAGVYTCKIYEISDATIKTLDKDFLPKGYPTATYPIQTYIENEMVEIPDGVESVQHEFYTDFVEGRTYIVTFDGSTYERVCRRSGSGNLSIGDPWEAGDPFYLLHSPSEGTKLDAEPGSHTISIKGIIEEVTRMDEKFMPLLTSPNGKKYKLTVSDDGILSAVAVNS